MEPIEAPARGAVSPELLAAKMVAGALFVAPAIAIWAICLLTIASWLAAKLAIKHVRAAMTMLVGKPHGAPRVAVGG